MEQTYLFGSKIALLFMCIFFSISGWAEDTDIKICTDGNYWYPFTYADAGISKGLHVDIVQKACDSLNITCSFEPLPWKRCLAYAEDGNIDAVVSASYKPERAEYLWYPPESEKSGVSPWRVTQAEYVVVTYANNQYKFDGDVNKIPQPIRIPFGYSIGDYFLKQGIKVSTDLTSHQNFKNLSKLKSGSVVTIEPNAKKIINELKLEGKVKIHNKTLKSKSYFITFSKKSKISENQRKALWQAVVDVRDNPVEFDKLLAPY